MWNVLNIGILDTIKGPKSKVVELDDQNREIRTKRKEDSNSDDRPLIESLQEKFFLRQRKRSENANRRNATQQGKSSSQISSLSPITEESPYTKEQTEAIFNRHLVGTVKDREEPFFPKWSLKNKSQLIYGGAT